MHGRTLAESVALGSVVTAELPERGHRYRSCLSPRAEFDHGKMVPDIVWVVPDRRSERSFGAVIVHGISSVTEIGDAEPGQPSPGSRWARDRQHDDRVAGDYGR